MSEFNIQLRYGLNPHQKPAFAGMANGSLPFTVLNGSPGYINLLDALNSWQLVNEVSTALGVVAAASFKHVSPAGAAIAVKCDNNRGLSALASAYSRARGADRVSSFGDWIALSDNVDIETARLVRREVSDGVIAPGFDQDAFELLRAKQNGRYCMLQIDKSYVPPSVEKREVYGVTLTQTLNSHLATDSDLTNVQTQQQEIPNQAKRDLILALTTLKFTQSNSICLAVDGQIIGVGAGQQSRIHCTRLACSKADIWFLRQHPTVEGLQFREGLGRPEKDNAIDGFLREDLSPAEQDIWAKNFSNPPARLSSLERLEWLRGMDGVSMASDAFIPFRDNVDRAAMSGVRYIVQPGGSVRDEDIIEACDQYGIAMAFSGFRLFHH